MAKTAPYSRELSTEELHEALVRQIGHLRRSAELYDKGVFEEAERLAAVAYILLHDGNYRTRALLSQLDLRDRMVFPASRTQSVVYHAMPLCHVLVEEGVGRYHPILHGENVPGYELIDRSFDDWWSEVIYSREPATLARQELVLALRFQDGGGHVDGAIRDEAYDLAKTLGNDRIHLRDGKPVVSDLCHGGLPDEEVRARYLQPPLGGNPPIAGAHWAVMRQIAWELDQALKRIGY